MTRTTRFKPLAALRAAFLGTLLAAPVVLIPPTVTSASSHVAINEIRIDQPGSDNDEYFELAGPAGTSLTGLTYLVIGDGTGGSGVIENVTSLTGQSIPASGLFVAAESTFSLATADLTASLNFENSDNVTHLLVENFSGSNGDDLDTNDDGALDSTPWTSIVDSVALVETVGSGDLVYSTTTVGPDGSFVPGHVYFCPGDWQIGSFTLGVDDTPGATNGCPVPPTMINEIRIDQPGSDNDEYFELAGPAGTSLTGLTYLVIGDGTGGSGVIENVTSLTGQSIPASGLFVAAESTFSLATADLTASLNFENSDNVTHLLVENFSGSNGDDLDTNDDGALDSTPWTSIVDSVALVETVGSGDLVYSTTTVGPDGSFVPGHVYFCPGDWQIGSFTLGVDDTPGATNDCEIAPPTIEFIHDVQGSGPSVAITGPVVVQGIVTSLIERDDILDGFFVQEEDTDADLDPNTSEGIFVFCRGNCPAVTAGDLVTVSGNAEEPFFNMSQINMQSGSAVVVSSGNPLPTPVAVDLPAAASTVDEATFENIEGMLVTFTDTLVVSEYFQLARFGQIVLTETSRPFQFTHDNAPSVTGYAAFLDDLAKRRIILDDDNNDNNDAISDLPDEAYYYPEGGLSLGNKFRGGDTIDGLTGVMHWSFAGSSGTDAWRVRPIPTEYDYTFTSVNPAPAAPASVGGSIQVASFNVLNYFTTIDLTSSNVSGDCGPSGTLDCRGADSVAELDNQREKIVAAMVELDADILGLIEIENDGDDASAADLVGALNAATAAGTYDYIPTGFIGSDAIKLALIYKPGSVSPLGDFAVLDSTVDPAFIDAKNRPVLIQTFEENATSERFTVAVNHLKSKGSSCAGDPIPDPDLNDGQANCNLTRTSAATALANYLATDPTNSGDPDFLIIGDLNAYAMEDPITALINAGYTDLINLFQGSSAYSFVFDGQLGYLDHALANAALLPQVTGVTAWHINADEVNVFDYNDDVNDAGEASFERESWFLPIFTPDPLRSSDHDPLLVGLALDSIPDNPTCNGLAATIIGTPGDDVIVGTNGNDVIVSFGGNDTIDAGNGSDVICSGRGDDVVDGGNGKDLIFGEQGADTLAGGNGKDSLDGGAGIDDGDGGNGKDTCTGLETAVSCEF